jgi:hypothetical protein
LLKDPAGLSPVLVSQSTNMSAARRAAGGGPTSSEVTAQAFARPLHGGALAVVLLNRGEAPANLTVSWGELGLGAGRRMAVRDVGSRRDLPDAAGRFESLVGKHDVAFIRLTPVATAAAKR